MAEFERAGLAGLAGLAVDARDSATSAQDSPLAETRWLLAGPAGSGTRWHYDPHGVCGWNVCLQGRKLWCFWPPWSGCRGWGLGWDSEVPVHAVPPRMEAHSSALGWFQNELLRMLQCTDLAASGALGKLQWADQRCGDAVYVPSGWWHAVLNLEAANVAFQQQLILQVPSAARGADVAG